MKNPFSGRLLHLLLLLTIFTNCKKSNISGPGSNNQPGTILVPTPVKASVQGKVIGENNLPVVGATVKAGNNTTSTDSRGFFFFHSINLDRYSSLITVEKAGYYKGLRNFSIKNEATGFIKIKLLTRAQVGTVSATTGGLVPMSSTHFITFLPNSVVNKITNQKYTGTIKVFATPIDPTAEDIGERIPGGLRAVDTSGRNVLLKSFGMMAVELEGQNGEALQLEAGKKAIIRFGIPASLQASAPTMIPLWWMDETTGLWKEEGYAIKNSTYYEGDVKHFTFWNADALLIFVNLDLTLKTPQGKVLPFTAVSIKRLLDGSGETGYTDSLGFVSGYVPSNEPLRLEVKNNCRQTIYTYELGPLTKNTSLGDITVSLPTQFSMQVSGTLVNCSNQAISKGNAMIFFEDQIYTVPVNSNGNFSATISRCPSTSMLEIIALDSTTRQQSIPYQFSVANGSINTGNLKACGGSLDSWFLYTFDGTPFTISTALGDTLVNGNMNDGMYGTQIPAVIGESISNPNVRLYLSFSDIARTGVYELVQMGVNNLQQFNFDQYQRVNITNFGPVGQFIEGNFDITILERGTTFHKVKGSFRVKRLPPPGP